MRYRATGRCCFIQDGRDISLLQQRSVPFDLPSHIARDRKIDLQIEIDR